MIFFCRKYLRDSERLHYSRLALDYCLSAIKNRLPDIRELQDGEKSLKLLMETYKIYNYGISKMKATLGPRISNLMAATFKAVMKEEVNIPYEYVIYMCMFILFEFLNFFYLKGKELVFFNQCSTFIEPFYKRDNI